MLLDLHSNITRHKISSNQILKTRLFLENNLHPLLALAHARLLGPPDELKHK